ncbi:uncharacterized protein J3D65DRAFT_220988 [Phyllosticta citribraziliensis]|uniref:Uncharacterized protein n=1 Tax=Phyllosticta citribraziliensis TaxID=989973 RepID=A0ABR1M4R1_9PEZI
MGSISDLLVSVRILCSESMPIRPLGKFRISLDDTANTVSNHQSWRSLASHNSSADQLYPGIPFRQDPFQPPPRYILWRRASNPTARPCRKRRKDRVPTAKRLPPLSRSASTTSYDNAKGRLPIQEGHGVVQKKRVEICQYRRGSDRPQELAEAAGPPDPNLVREARRPRAYRHATRRSAFASLLSLGWRAGWACLRLQTAYDSCVAAAGPQQTHRQPRQLANFSLFWGMDACVPHACPFPSCLPDDRPTSSLRCFWLEMLR